MALTGKQLGQIRDALVDAFGKEADLHQMLVTQLDEDLYEVTESGNMRDRAFGLAEWANREGRVAKLIASALAEKPNNPSLIYLAEQSKGWDLDTPKLTEMRPTDSVVDASNNSETNVDSDAYTGELPEPAGQPKVVPLSEVDRDLYNAWSRHIQSRYAEGESSAREAIAQLRRPLKMMYWFYYGAMFFAAFFLVLSLVSYLWAGDKIYPLVMGAIGVLIFFLTLMARPFAAIEEATTRVTIMEGLFNTYVMRLYNIQSPETFAEDLSHATEEFNKGMEGLSQEQRPRRPGRA